MTRATAHGPACEPCRIECLYCGADPGEPCRWAPGAYAEPGEHHGTRVKVALIPREKRVRLFGRSLEEPR